MSSGRSGSCVVLASEDLQPEKAVVITGAGAVPPFFAGLLPEGRRLGALRRSVKTSVDDELTLVMAVGGDTVGDVRVVPEGESPGPVPTRLQVESFDQVRFADLLAKMAGVRSRFDQR